MPVRKYRSVEDMNQPVWRNPGDPQLYRSIAAVWARARRMNPRRFTHGVFRYRSIEDMSRAREEAVTEHVRALRRDREGR